jgi:HAMP domain-containing protein/GAF domain-containing protein
MKRFNLNIGQKVLIANVAILVFFIVNVLISLYTLNQSKTLVRNSSQTLSPSVEALREFILIVTRSRMYITNWAYTQHANQNDKEALAELHNIELPALKRRLSDLKTRWDDRELVAELDSIVVRFDDLVLLQERIMNQLNSFDDYNDPNKTFFAHARIEDEIIPVSYRLIDRLETLSRSKKLHKDENDLRLMQSLSTLQNIMLVLGLLLLITGLVASWITFRTISKPIKQLSRKAMLLAEGKIPDDYPKEFSNDEVGEMGHAMHKLVEGLKATSAFAEKIGKGEYDTHYEPLSKDDLLGNALLNMRDNLRRVGIESQRRRWSNEGLAKFGDLMRVQYASQHDFAEEIVVNLVKYMNGNQGSVFLLDEATENTSKPILRLEGCYAWDRKKNVERTIAKGEGLTGQAWIEESTLYITDVPDGYVYLSSALGEANPTCLLIVPIKVSDKVIGVFELAFFNTLEKYQIAFVERIAETFASALSVVRNNEKTRQLLEESKILNDQMLNQEEAMRQSLEMLMTTQEENLQTQRRFETQERLIDSGMLVIETDAAMHVTAINTLAQKQLDIGIGQPLAKLFEQETDYKECVRLLSIKDNAGMLALLHGTSATEGRVWAKMNLANIYDERRHKIGCLIMADNLTEIRKLVEKNQMMIY